MAILSVFSENLPKPVVDPRYVFKEYIDRVGMRVSVSAGTQEVMWQAQDRIAFSEISYTDVAFQIP